MTDKQKDGGDEFAHIRIPFIAKFIGKTFGGWKDDSGKRYDADNRCTVDYKKAMDYRFNMNQARGIVTPDEHGFNKVQRVEPGKRVATASLYPVCGTPINDLGDFGLGIGLYFRTLQAVGVFLVICFLINVPVMTYFATTYNQYEYCEQSLDAKKECSLSQVPESIIGTAWCPYARYGGSTGAHPQTDSGFFEFAEEDFYKTVAVSNGAVESTSDFRSTVIHECPFTKAMAVSDLISTMLSLVFIFILGRVQDHQVDEIDEGIQTAQDYTVEVEDPGDGPADNDPNEWKTFFEQFGAVTGVTIAKKNGKLMRLLCERKVLLSNVEKMGWNISTDGDFIDEQYRRALEKGDPLPDDAVTKNKRMEKNCRGIEKKNSEVLVEVQALLKLLRNDGAIHNARVYVTFEFEEAQRKCLRTLSTGTIPAFLDIPKSDGQRRFWNQRIPQKLYRPMDPGKAHEFVGEFGPDKNVLMVTQAPEPDDVLWENHDKEPYEVLLMQVVLSAVALMIVGTMTVAILYLESWAASFIAVCNGVLPPLMKMLNQFEPHPTRTAQEASLLFKLVLARWTITGMVIYCTTKWAEWVSNDKVAAILGILIADAFITPTVRMLDLAGWFNKLILAPCAKTQEGMEKLFKGTGWFLAERFSDMTKTVFVCYFYSALIPSSYLIAAIALFYNFWVDKYCLLRVWQVKEPLDAKIVATTRAHLAIIVVIHCITTLHYWAGWPFDGILCKDENGDLLAHTQEKCDGHFQTDEGEYKTYAQIINMNLWNEGAFIFFNVRNYMEDRNQAYSVQVYIIICILCMVLVTTCFFGHTFGFTLYTLFVGVPQDSSEVAKHPTDKSADYYIKGYEDQPIGISYVETNAYVPQIHYPGIDNPQLAIYHPDLDATEPPKSFTSSVDVSRSWFPRAMLSWNESAVFGVHYRQNNLYLDAILDNRRSGIKSEDEKRKLFTSCNIFQAIRYQPGEGWAKDGHLHIHSPASDAAMVSLTMLGIGSMLFS